MPGSVINCCLLAELMSINSAFVGALPASFFSDFSDFGAGADFFVWLDAEPLAMQIKRNTTNRFANRFAFHWLNSFTKSLSMFLPVVDHAPCRDRGKPAKKGNAANPGELRLFLR